MPQKTSSPLPQAKACPGGCHHASRPTRDHVELTFLMTKPTGARPVFFFFFVISSLPWVDGCLWWRGRDGGNIAWFPPVPSSLLSYLLSLCCPSHLASPPSRGYPSPFLSPPHSLVLIFPSKSSHIKAAAALAEVNASSRVYWHLIIIFNVIYYKKNREEYTNNTYSTLKENDITILTNEHK